MKNREGNHWTSWVPETPEDIDEVAEDLCCQMQVGGLVRNYAVVMGELYDLRCKAKLFDATPNLTFAQIFEKYRQKQVPTKTKHKGKDE